MRTARGDVRSGVQMRIWSSCERRLPSMTPCWRAEKQLRSKFVVCSSRLIRNGGSNSSPIAALRRVTGGDALQAPLAMYPLGVSLKHPCPCTVPTTSRLALLPCGPKALVDAPSLSAGCDFLKIFGMQKMAREPPFSERKQAFGSMSPSADFGRLAAVPFRG